jgi:hypothetical protein
MQWCYEAKNYFLECEGLNKREKRLRVNNLLREGGYCVSSRNQAQRYVS